MNINYDSNSHVSCLLYFGEFCFMDTYYVYPFILEREVSRNKVVLPVLNTFNLGIMTFKVKS